MPKPLPSLHSIDRAILRVLDLQRPQSVAELRAQVERLRIRGAATTNRIVGGLRRLRANGLARRADTVRVHDTRSSTYAVERWIRTGLVT